MHDSLDGLIDQIRAEDAAAEQAWVVRQRQRDPAGGGGGGGCCGDAFESLARWKRNQPLLFKLMLKERFAALIAVLLLGLALGLIQVMPVKCGRWLVVKGDS